MYAEYAKEVDEDILFYEQADRPSDIPLPPGMDTLLLGGWAVIFCVGLAVIFIGKMYLMGALIIAIPTFIGMVIKPTFALCMIMLVLPTGAGVGFKQVFSLDRGVGIAVALSFALNLLISQPHLRVRHKALWVLIAYSVWIGFSSLVFSYLRPELARVFRQFQLLALVFIVYWILETNGESTFRWVLRSYVIGALGTIAVTYMTGAAMKSVEETGGRYEATLGQAIDANMLSVLIGMAFWAAIYLFARDKKVFFRIIYLTAIIFLPIMILRTGSRGGLIALVFTILSPLLSLRQVARKPALMAPLLVVILLASVSTALLVKKKGLETGVARRLTDIQYAKSSINYRLDLVRKAAKCAIKYPAGTSYLGWFERADAVSYPHSDFFFALGLHGIPAAMLFALFVIMMMFTVKRIPLGLEKLYARAALTFLLISGLDIVQLYQKHYWVFIAVIMAAERISWLNSDVTEYIHSGTDEKSADINY